MGFIIKLVVVLFIFSFIVYVLKAIMRLSFYLRGTIKDVQKIRDQVGGGGRPVASAEMVKCAACGSFVAAQDAVTVSARNRAQHFCSQTCVRASVAK